MVMGRREPTRRRRPTSARHRLFIGSALRPLPTRSGHYAAAQAVIRSLTDDFIPGVVAHVRDDPANALQRASTINPVMLGIRDKVGAAS
jgi:hypothetical protein